MNIYERNYKNIKGLIEKAKENKGHVKIKVSGYMDLVVEILEKYSENEFKISLTHYYEQNGDLVSDPDMEIRVWDNMEMVEALTFEQQNLGICQVVYPEPGKYYPGLKKQLNSFLGSWLTNLKKQGFMK